MISEIAEIQTGLKATFQIWRLKTQSQSITSNVDEILKNLPNNSPRMQSKGIIKSSYKLLLLLLTIESLAESARVCQK